MLRPDYHVPSLEQVLKTTKKRSVERKALRSIYGSPFGYYRHPIYNNFYFQPDNPILGSVRSVFDSPKKGLQSVDSLYANESFTPLEAVMQRVMDLPVDLDLIMRVYERLSTNRILSDIRVCAALEVVTGQEDPQRVSQAFVVYPSLYERSENKFVSPGVVGEQMALFYLQQTQKVD